MSPRKLDSETRKQQIIEAAMAIFARKGFYRASMDDIVRESGLSKGGLYWHFKSKDDIIVAILEQFFNREMAELGTLLTAEMPVSERFSLIVQHAMDEMEKMTELMPLTLEFYAAAIRQEKVSEFLRLYYAQYRAMVEALIQQGIDAGEFREAPLVETAISVTAQFEGIVLLWVLDPDAFDLRQQSESAVRLLLEGLQVGD